MLAFRLLGRRLLVRLVRLACLLIRQHAHEGGVRLVAVLAIDLNLLHGLELPHGLFRRCSIFAVNAVTIGAVVAAIIPKHRDQNGLQRFHVLAFAAAL